MVLGFSTTYLLFNGAKQTYFNQVAKNLKSIAATSALLVDSNAINALNQPEQNESEEFGDQTKILTHIINANPQITHVSILKQVGPQYHFIVDASALGQSGSKSELLDPADEIPTELTQAVTKSEPTSTDSPQSDRWGEWYSGFAPILDKSGKTIAVLQVDAAATEINVPSQELLQRFQLTILLISVSCLIIAWLASGPVTSGLVTLNRATKSPFKKSFIELTLAIVIIAMSLDLGFAISRQSQMNQLSSENATIHAAAHKAEEISESLRNNNTPTFEELKSSKPLFQQTKNGKLYDDFAQMIQSKNWSSSNLDNIDQTIKHLLKQEASTAAQIQNLHQAQAQTTYRALIGFLFVSFITIVLIRYASNLDHRIDHTVVTSNSIQSQLSSLVENLPVGLFELESGKLSFANNEFKNQVGSASDDITLDILGDSIHPEDNERVLAEIKNSATYARPFQTQYRITKLGYPTLHVETRGVPVYDNDGVCRRMLAFTVDFSAAVEAKEALQSAYGEVEHKNKLLSNALAELETNLESVVKALVKAVEAKDPYTAGHSERVMQYSLWLGDAIGLGPYERRILELGTLVHDVGKIGIPDAILTKPDRLTEEEYDIIKKHPEYGVNIISDIEMFKECIPIVRWHHERLDGRGYPDQLKDQDIPLLVRISAIADIFDAMTSTRAYRKGMELEKVLQVMSELSEKGEIDNDLFNTFCQVIHKKGIIGQQVQQEPWKAA